MGRRLCAMTEQEQKMLRGIIRGGVAEGVLLAGMLLVIFGFVFGMFLSGM